MDHRSLHFLIVELNRLFNRSVAFVLAYVRPGILDVWYGPFVDCRCVGSGELKKHLTGDMLAIQLLWAHFFENLGPQLLHLIDEFRS